jgi:hypothetical protein
MVQQPLLMSQDRYCGYNIKVNIGFEHMFLLDIEPGWRSKWISEWIWQYVRSCDESSPEVGRKWKWSNGVETSEMGIV